MKNIAIDWEKYSKTYDVPSVVKERILKPFFDKKFKSPILDLGCGKGYFSKMLAKRNLKVVGLDMHTNLRSWRNFKFIKSDLLSFIPSEKFKTIFLINVLSTIARKQHFRVFQKIKHSLDKSGQAIVLNMNPAIYKVNFQSQYLKVKKTNQYEGVLDFTLINGDHRIIRDLIVSQKDVEKICKKVGLNIVKKVKLGFTKQTYIYDLYFIKIK